MKSTITPLIAVSVALAGVGVIASPPQPVALPDMQVAAVDLTAFPVPSSDWADIFETAFNNLSHTADQWFETPFVFAQQALANQITDVATLFNSLENLANVWIDGPPPLHFADYGTVETGFEGFFNYLFNGDFALASVSLTQGAAWLGTMSYQAMEPVTLMPGQIVDNLGNILSAFANVGSPTGDGILGILANSDPLDSVIMGLGGALQQIADGDFQSILDIPAMLTDSFLNGFGPGLFGSVGSGVTSPFDIFTNGPIAAWLVTVPDILAQAIGWDGIGNPLEDVLSSLFS